MTYIDLHCHSTFSDGTLTPEELIDKARELKLSHLAITDHDTISGLDSAYAYASNFSDIEIISGIEITVTMPKSPFEGHEFHMLGLGFDISHPALLSAMEFMKEARNDRNHRTIKALQEEGVDITYSEVEALAPDGVLTRTHLARLMLEKGYVATLDEAFKGYFQGNAKTNLPKNSLLPREAIEIIHSAGGVAILAHPMRYGLSHHMITQLVMSLSRAGIDAIEAIYYSHSLEDERFLRGLALSEKLLISGGSDYHGKNRNVELGIGYGELRIGLDIWEKLKRRVKC